MEGMDVKCSGCKETVETKAERIPSGWKRLPSGVLCAACVNARYVLRAVTFPVSGPVDGDWPALREALKTCWQQSTCLANWAVNELAKADVVRLPGQEKMPKMPAVYLYGLAKQKYPGWSDWDGACAAAQSVLRSVESKYRKARLATVWRSEAALPTHRYPVPYPTHNQNWTARYLEHEGSDGHVSRVPVVDVTLAGTAFTLRLQGGAQFRRQLADFARIAAGEAVQGELAVYRVRDNRGDHRNGVEAREPGGGRRNHYRVMVKLVARLPRKEPAKRVNTMLLKTDPNAFLVAEVEGRAPWIVNADHVRRWVESHRVYRQRMSEDLKHEKRWPKEVRQRMVEALAERCRKQNARLDSFTHQVSAMVANYAARCRAGEVIYDPSCRDYLPSFPWHDFRTKLAYKLDALGILLTGGETRDEEGE